MRHSWLPDVVVFLIIILFLFLLIFILFWSLQPWRLREKTMVSRSDHCSGIVTQVKKGGWRRSLETYEIHRKRWDIEIWSCLGRPTRGEKATERRKSRQSWTYQKQSARQYSVPLVQKQQTKANIIQIITPTPGRCLQEQDMEIAGVNHVDHPH